MRSGLSASRALYQPLAGNIVASIAPVADQYFMVRDDNSPDGDPYRATAWGAPQGVRERPPPYKRQRQAIASLLTVPLPIGGRP